MQRSLLPIVNKCHTNEPMKDNQNYVAASASGFAYFFGCRVSEYQIESTKCCIYRRDESVRTGKIRIATLKFSKVLTDVFLSFEACSKSFKFVATCMIQIRSDSKCFRFCH